MAFLRTVVVVLLAALPVAAADNLTTLDGKKLSGEIVSITGNELTFKTAAGSETLLVTTINFVIVGPAPKALPAGSKYIAVELTDGSTFRCESFAIKGKTVELKLIGTPGRTIEVPMNTLFSVLRDAQDIKLEQDFRGLLRGRGKFDLWVTKGKTKNDAGIEVDRLDSVPGTFGEGDATADAIKFTMEATSKEVAVKMPRVAGMIFNQIASGKIDPAICRVIDADGNGLVAKTIARTPGGYAVTTVTGVKFDLPNASVSKFDFAAGSVKYLSDLDPAVVQESGTDPEHYQRDRNLDKQPIRLFTAAGGDKPETFAKGLTLHAKTVLAYDVKGQYKVFKAIAGIDASVETPAAVRLTIDDGSVVIYKGTIKKGDKPLDLNLSVQNVDRLRIIVETDGPGLDLGNQLTLASARVLK